MFLSAGLLAGCSTNDVLTLNETPPAAVGNTQSQIQASLVPAPPVSTAPEATVDRQNLAPPMATNTTQMAAPQPTTMDDTPGTGRPPSTFGAQAASIRQPALTTNQTTAQQVAQTQAATAVPPAAPTMADTASQQPPAGNVAAATPTTVVAANTTATANITYDTIRFLPIIGAPENKLQALSKRLGDSARASGLSIVRMSDDTADLSLKGYFSAVTEDGQVKVIYVWDVLGADGQRLHRIQGNETGTAGKSTDDPWQSVTPEMMATVGQNSIGALMNWIDSQT